MRPYGEWRSVEVPKLMRTLPKDHRGYPIPFIVLRDKAKQPHFPINDVARVVECGRKRLCGICGKRLNPKALSFVIGGPASALHERGAYLDPPMHEECARYAIRVCPYLGAPVYGRMIEDRKLADAQRPAGVVIGIASEVIEDRPAMFGLVGSPSWEVVSAAPGHCVFRLPGPAAVLEWWHAGERVQDERDIEEAIAVSMQRAEAKAHG
jgi:hypothetical protein